MLVTIRFINYYSCWKIWDRKRDGPGKTHRW